MTTAAQRIALGRFGESLAARHLAAQGLVLLDRNWHCDLGEIDLVLRDGDTLVICEVKTRRDTSCGHPVEAVDDVKAQRLRLLGLRWAETHGVRPDGVRLDVVGVLASGHGPALVEHVRGL